MYDKKMTLYLKIYMHFCASVTNYGDEDYLEHKMFSKMIHAL